VGGEPGNQRREKPVEFWIFINGHSDETTKYTKHTKRERRKASGVRSIRQRNGAIQASE
jgi:hypothetical protein